MQVRPEDKAKTIFLLCAIVLVIVFFVGKFMIRSSENRINPEIGQHVTVASVQTVMQARPSDAPIVDPFWRPFSVSLVTTKPILATPHTSVDPHAKQSAATDAGESAGSHAQVKPVTLDLELQGILSDSSSVAIVRVGDKVRYLREGSEVDSVTSLRKILPDRIIIGQNGTEQTVMLGRTLVRGGSGTKSTGTESSASGEWETPHHVSATLH